METNTKLEATQDTDALVTLWLGKNVIETCVTRMGQSDCPHIVLGVPPPCPWFGCWQLGVTESWGQRWVSLGPLTQCVPNPTEC